MRYIVTLAALAVSIAPSMAADAPTYSLEIKDSGFAPAALTIPAGTRVRLLVTNARTLPSEFESFDLNREKVVPPGVTVTVWIGPLKVGDYEIFDDFNPDTTGRIMATEPGAEQTQ